jgi:RluA family pseudouridine synthase
MVDYVRKNSFKVSKDDYLFNSCVEGFSFIVDKNFLRELIINNRLFVNSKSVLDILGGFVDETSFIERFDSLTVKKGDLVVLLTPQSEEPPVDLNYDVVFEDEDILVVDKSGNCPVHPAGKYYFNTLQSQLERQGKGVLHPAHRIDRETSGHVIFAKNKSVLSELHELFAKGLVKKQYLAIVFGCPPNKGLIDKSLLKTTITTEDGVFRDVVVCSDSYLAKDAKTFFTNLRTSSDNKFSLLSLRLEGGRKHQIRVHLSCNSWPVVGDSLYGNSKKEFIELHNLIKKGFRFTDDEVISIKNSIVEKTLSPRQLLHANFLEFNHPRTGERLELNSPLPVDMVEFIRLNF